MCNFTPSIPYFFVFVVACDVGPERPGDAVTLPSYHKLGTMIRLQGFESFATLLKDLRKWSFDPSLTDQQVFDSEEFRRGYATFVRKIWELIENLSPQRVSQVLLCCGGYVEVSFHHIL